MNDEKQIVGARQYMNTQCPNAGFQHGDTINNLLKTIAVGQSNGISLLIKL